MNQLLSLPLDEHAGIKHWNLRVTMNEQWLNEATTTRKARRLNDD